MSLLIRKIWFWQGIVTPHMAALVTALAEGGHDVTYVARELMSSARAQQGWVPAQLGRAKLEVFSDRQHLLNLLASCPDDSIHITQGLRNLPWMREVRTTLARRGLTQFVIMETIDDAHPLGWIKRWVYRRLIARWHVGLSGILAIGHRTTAWLINVGACPETVFPFTYFLAGSGQRRLPDHLPNQPFRFIFVGQLIQRKRVDLLLAALSQLQQSPWELLLVGSGPKESELRNMAEDLLSGRVQWLGQLSMSEVTDVVAKADCLVLPSSSEGWGAVISEALMAGTPVVCSDVCGAAGVARASGHGSIFRSGDLPGLVKALDASLRRGGLLSSQRHDLIAWSSCLGAEAGADYLLKILDYRLAGKPRPLPPWA